VLDGTWSPPAGDGSGRDRNLLRQALTLLTGAGYELNGTVLRNRATGRPLSFEIMVTNRDDERLALAFAASLGRAGIAVQVRVLDRVLISGAYVVPLFYLPEQWVARRAPVRHPARTSLFGFLPDSWWRAPEQTRQ